MDKTSFSPLSLARDVEAHPRPIFWAQLDPGQVAAVMTNLPQETCWATLARVNDRGRKVKYIVLADRRPSCPNVAEVPAADAGSAVLGLMMSLLGPWTSSCPAWQHA